MRDIAERRQLAVYGIHLPDTAIYAEDSWMDDFLIAADAQPAMFNFAGANDVQPTLITSSNAGVPAFLTNIIDPQIIRILVAPMRAVEIMGGEQKKGDWTTLTTQFPIVEAVGEVSSYGDFNNNGNADVNENWEPRQSYHFQTITTWGERQMALAGLGGIGYASELNVSSALIMNKFMNKSYFYGVSSLQNYGLLNDPGLIAPITPATKAAGGTTWVNATQIEIYNDIVALYTQLVVQMGGNLVDMNAEMTLALSPTRMVQFARINNFGQTAMSAVKAQFPNLRITTAPEYTTGSGELMQMILNTVDGVQSAYASFTEKMRAHPVIPELSGFRQKKSGGTWGAIIRRPIAIAQMLGI